MAYTQNNIYYVNKKEFTDMRKHGQIYQNDKGLWKLKGTGFTVVQNDIIAKLGPAAINGTTSNVASTFGNMVTDAATSIAMRTIMGARAAADTVVHGNADKNHYKATQDLFTTGELKDQNLGWSKVTFDDKVHYFNISMLPDYENAAEPYFAFILMTRPSLRLNDANMQVLRDYPMTGAYVNDKYGYELLKSISAEADNIWMPLITTQAKNYTVTDSEIDTIEKGATYYGHSLKYGKHSEKHKQSNTISIDFRNDRFLSILKMMQIWMGYIYLVSKTDWIQPLEVYQKTGVLDYAGSIYYLVTRRDMRELVYWEKLTGVFPLKTPYSIFNYNDTPILEDTISVEFSYGIRSDPNDPNILLDINALNGVSLTQQQAQGYIQQDEDYTISNGKMIRNTVGYEHFLGDYPFTKGDNLVTHPYITVQKDNSGNVKYFLHWIGDPEHGGNITTFARTAAEKLNDFISKVGYNAETNAINAFDSIYAKLEDGSTGITWNEYMNSQTTGASISPDEVLSNKKKEAEEKEKAKAESEKKAAETQNAGVLTDTPGGVNAATEPRGPHA